MKAINLSQAKHQLITLPFVWLLAIFVAGWVGKPWLVDALGLVTTARADQQAQAVAMLGEQVNSHIVEYRMDKAYVMIRNTERDLSDHNAETPHDAAWRETERGLKEKVHLAHEYKECLQDGKSNCHLIQQQIWR